MEPKRRFGSLEFRSKVKAAGNYKRMFNPSGGFSLKIIPSTIFGKTLRIVGVGILLVVLYFTVISNKFTISQVSVNGNQQVSNQQIENLVLKKNIFFLSKGRANKILTDNVPTIKEIISYNRSWPNKVEIEIVEHIPGFVILSNNHYFLVDDQGIVVEQVEDTKNLLVVEDQLVESFSRGEILPSQKLATFILSMSKSWPTKINTGLSGAKFPGKSSNEVQFVTTTGWAVLFDTTRSVSTQLSDLSVILSKQIKSSELANLAYIDLRLSKWVYYCFKATPCQSQGNEASGTQIETNDSE